MENIGKQMRTKSYDSEHIFSLYLVHSDPCCVILHNKTQKHYIYSMVDYNIIVAYFHQEDAECFPMVGTERPSLMIMKAISTNNSNYMSLLLKCDKADNVAFIEFIMLTGTSSFHLSLIRYGLSERAQTDNYISCCFSLWL